MTRTRNREYNFAKWCEWCGESFSASRSDARFCEGKCRSAANRAELKRSKKLERIKRDIDSLLMNCRLEVADLLAREIAAYADVYTVKTIGGND